MNLNMGGQLFRDVQVPVLWGTRAVVQDRRGRLSVIDLSGKEARVEILGDEPAPQTEFRPTEAGFDVLRGRKPLYGYDPVSKTLYGIGLDLPECQIGPRQTRIGTNTFSGTLMNGIGVGIVVEEGGQIGMGARIPPGLAALVV